MPSPCLFTHILIMHRIGIYLHFDYLCSHAYVYINKHNTIGGSIRVFSYNEGTRPLPEVNTMSDLCGNCISHLYVCVCVCVCVQCVRTQTQCNGCNSACTVLGSIHTYHLNLRCRSGHIVSSRPDEISVVGSVCKRCEAY